MTEALPPLSYAVHTHTHTHLAPRPRTPHFPLMGASLPLIT